MNTASRRLAALTIAGLTMLAACGSDDDQAAAPTAPPASFCDLARTAKDLGDAVDPNRGDPEQLRSQFAVALEASKAAAAAAPDDYAEVAAKTVELQEATAALLDTYDYDIVAAFASDEGQTFFEDPGYTATQEERERFLMDECDIEPTEPDDQDRDLTLRPGVDGIRQLMTLLQANDGWHVSDDQADCAIEGLSGKIGDADLTAFANGREAGISEGAKLLINVVFSDCEIVPPGS